jgi:hypothetical protein
MFSEEMMRYVRPVLRTLGALAVAYIFLVTLLFGTAQQRVVDDLAANAVGYDYSVAAGYYFGKDSVSTQRKANSEQIKTINRAMRETRDKLADADRLLAGQTADLAQDLRNLAAAGCATAGAAAPAASDAGDASGAVAPTSAPAPGAPDPGTLLNAALAVQHCAGAATDPRVRQLGNEVSEAATNVGRSLDTISAFKRDIDDSVDQLKRLEDERATVDEHSQAAAKAANSMAVLRIFQESNWLPGRLVYIPPAMMAIILAFSSGLFGALLITLVIFVYPENSFNFTRSNSFFGRILLGGLIAIGVFVLLFSGVAVLGGSGGDASSHNLMAYSAIGILSGMFSDQAAAWLSSRSVFTPKEQNSHGVDDADGPDRAADPPVDPLVTPPAQP